VWFNRWKADFNREEQYSVYEYLRCSINWATNTLPFALHLLKESMAPLWLATTLVKWRQSKRLHIQKHLTRVIPIHVYAWINSKTDQHTAICVVPAHTDSGATLKICPVMLICSVALPHKPCRPTHCHMPARFLSVNGASQTGYTCKSWLTRVIPMWTLLPTMACVCMHANEQYRCPRFFASHYMHMWIILEILPFKGN
jgi:hypothetical protein